MMGTSGLADQLLRVCPDTKNTCPSVLTDGIQKATLPPLNY